MHNTRRTVLICAKRSHNYEATYTQCPKMTEGVVSARSGRFSGICVRMRQVTVKIAQNAVQTVISYVNCTKSDQFPTTRHYNDRIWRFNQ